MQSKDEVGHRVRFGSLANFLHDTSLLYSAHSYTHSSISLYSHSVFLFTFSGRHFFLISQIEEIPSRPEAHLYGFMYQASLKIVNSELAMIISLPALPSRINFAEV